MSSIQDIKGVGETTAKLLVKLGLQSPIDLIENIPRKYDDYSRVMSVRSIKPGPVTIQARIHAITSRYSKKGLHITEALASDSTGSVKIMWFNQRYRAQSLNPDAEYFISGDFAQSYRYLVIANPSCELVSAFPLHTARLVPQYRLTKGLSANQLRKFTKNAFDQTKVTETLPQWIVDEKELVDRRTALFSMHFPESLMAVDKARKRLGFEELFEMSLASALNKQDFAQEKAQHIPFSESTVVEFVKSLSFELTNDQRKSAWAVLQDMTSGSPMNRLLEGDVGSGKTVVATIAMLNVAADGKQSVLMAPTELLATQHANTIEKILPKGVASQVVLLSAGMKKQQKDAAKLAIKKGDARLIIGTHALIQDKVEFNDLGLAVIDEQHRFGVEQRKKLQSKAKTMPHILNMTATPIPRSLTLTLYGEMDVSIIAEKPGNRTSTTTKILLPEQRKTLYESLKSVMDNGRQIFVVCPLIEEGEAKAARSLSVESIHKQLKSWLKGYEVALLHGKMPASDKQAIMNDFIKNKINVLVSTTVIEVGVDIPNASVMIVEGADKFGLAQLHQLRGRVGRGVHAGSCYLIPTDNDSVPKRLRVLESENDGFKLAEYDLELRGPGAIYGTMQHGALDLRVAKITDTKMIAEARSAALAYIKKGENLLKYPQLKVHVDRLRTITNLN